MLSFMPRRAAVRSRGGPQSRFAAEARVRLRALRSPRPGVLTIACRTRAAQALAKVNEWDTKKTGKHTRSDVIKLLTALAYQSKAHRNGQSGQGPTLCAPRKKVLEVDATIQHGRAVPF